MFLWNSGEVSVPLVWCLWCRDVGGFALMWLMLMVMVPEIVVVVNGGDSRDQWYLYPTIKTKRQGNGGGGGNEW